MHKHITRKSSNLKEGGKKKEEKKEEGELLKEEPWEEIGAVRELSQLICRSRYNPIRIVSLLRLK